MNIQQQYITGAEKMQSSVPVGSSVKIDLPQAHKLANLNGILGSIERYDSDGRIMVEINGELFCFWHDELRPI
jgi:hypothetical protein